MVPSKIGRSGTGWRSLHVKRTREELDVGVYRRIALPEGRPSKHRSRQPPSLTWAMGHDDQKTTSTALAELPHYPFLWGPDLGPLIYHSEDLMVGAV